MEQKEFAVMLVVEGAHYELAPQDNNHKLETHKDAFNQMLQFKNQCNERTFLMTAKIGDTRDVIRTDTIKKMYVMRKYK